MSEQKKIKLSFSSNEVISLDDDRDCEQIVLGSSRSSVRTEVAAEENVSDWREKVRGVKERNLIALKNSILTDITLEVGPENTPFKAHKLILALGSPVFEAMFYGPLAEKGEKVIIPDITPDGFKVLLKYLYGDITILSTEIEALNAWFAADKYCVPKLKKDCDDFFCNCPMSSSNIWKLLENAVFLSLGPLISRCKKYLEKHTESSLRGEGFLEIRTETIKQIFDISSANVGELVLLNSAIHWGRHKVDTREAVSLTEALKPLLPHIRFGALTPSEFCQFLDNTDDLLEQSDALAILKHLTKPLTYALPEWCCLTTWQRDLRGKRVYPDSRPAMGIFSEHENAREPSKKLKKRQSLPQHFRS
ncbi:unnamed protein product [Larinioides sclopetarius]|uniref:BTB domain-containing protein n=1 Tax=Larinioides sclopetarius TaxID=280406 RepID=A0AAV2BTX9_9ARAC